MQSVTELAISRGRLPQSEFRVSGPINEQLGVTSFLDYKYFPALKIIMGKPVTLSDLAFTENDLNRQTYIDFSRECRKRAEEIHIPDNLSALDQVALRILKVKLLEFADIGFHPVFKRTTSSLSFFINPHDFIRTVDKKLDDLDIAPDVKQQIMRARITTTLGRYGEELLQLGRYVLGTDDEIAPEERSGGITKSALEQTAKTIQDVREGRDENSLYGLLNSLWNKEYSQGHTEVEQAEINEVKQLLENIPHALDPQEFETLWSSYILYLDILSKMLEQSSPLENTAWGEEAVNDWLSSRMIPHTGRKILAWAEQNFQKLERVAGEIGKRLVNGADDWRDAWDRLDIPPQSETPNNEILQIYKHMTAEIVTRMVRRGLIPDIPPGHDIEIQIASPELTRSFPKGVLYYAPYSDMKKKVMIYLPDPLVDPSIYRELCLAPELFAVHEAGRHALQQMYKTTLPEALTTNGLVTVAFEGDAFSSELVAFEEGIIHNSLENFFAIVRGRIQRAARVIFELKYHLGLEDTEKLLEEMAHHMGIPKDLAQGNAVLGMDNFGSLSSYYLGAGGFETFLQMAEKNGLPRSEAMRMVIKDTGSQLTPNILAYLYGWITDPSDPIQFHWLGDDRAVQLWEKKYNNLFEV